MLGTFTVGLGALGIAFDGANLWVANNAGGSVTELRASDGAVLGTFPTPPAPYGVAFDGTDIWVSGDFIYQLRASDGAIVDRIFPPTTNTTGVAFDGANVWVAGYNIGAVGKL